MAGNTELRFHAADYAVFVIGLVAAASVGVIQGIIDLCKRKQTTTDAEKQENADLGGRNLSVWPASLSIMASVTAAPFVLGIPAEIYAYGTMFALVGLAYLVGVPVMSHFFFQRWYNMGITSMYEFLEIRFNRAMRSLATALFAFTMLLYMGIIVYAPALAFSQVSGVNLTLCILLVGIIGIVYTAVGGLKGVLWVDAIQMLIILAGVLAVNIKGTQEVGGLARVWELAGNGSRLKVNELSVDPEIRHTAWTQGVGGIFFVMVMFCNQSVVQKFLGLPSTTKMHVTSYISMVAIIMYFLLFVFAGLVIYAYYATCDPLITGRVASGDQLVPLFVLEIFQDVHGIPGLFTSAVFGASLSSVAGGMNALAAVTLLDVIGPLLKRFQGNKPPNPRASMILFKILVVLYGVLTIGIAFLTPLLGSSVVQLALSIVGTLGAPIFAVFAIGIFCPFVNSIGAAVGCLASLAFSLWLNIGAIVTGANRRAAVLLPLKADGCSAPAVNASDDDVISTLAVTSTVSVSTEGFTGAPDVPEKSGGGIHDLYGISYMWYSLIGFLVVLALSTLVSALTGFRRGEPVDKSVSFVCCYKTTGQDEEEFYPDYKQKDEDHTANGTANMAEFTPHPGYDNIGYSEYANEQKYSQPNGHYQQPGTDVTVTKL